MSEEITDDDYLCAECIDKADCFVHEYLLWYKYKSCWMCSKQVKTMRVQYITIKETDDE